MWGRRNWSSVRTLVWLVDPLHRKRQEYSLSNSHKNPLSIHRQCLVHRPPMTLPIECEHAYDGYRAFRKSQVMRENCVAANSGIVRYDHGHECG